MLIFDNGLIHTLDPARPTAECLVVGDDGRIVYVGDRDAAPAHARRIDLAGATLLPGFNDAHVHIWKLGLLLTVQVDARKAAAPDIPAIIAAFKARAAVTPPGQWLTGRGYNEVDLPEGRHPTRHDLDQASTEHPIALTRTCGHMIVANSKALELAGITRDTVPPPGGAIVRDEHGEPTGLVQETAMGLITRVITDPDDATMGRAIEATFAHQLALGITSATDPLLTPDHLRVYRQLEAERRIRVRVNGLPIRRPDGGTITLPLPEKYVSDTLRIDGVKFFADGGLSGATAAISQPYKTVGGSGILRFDDDELRMLMQEAHDAGFRIATHAIGDVAIEQVIRTYEAIQAANPQPIRHRIEHLGLPSADHLRRCRALKVIAVPQTIFLRVFGLTYRRYLPDAFYPRCYPVRAMLDAGLTVALSSDAPVVPDDNPLVGLQAAVDRADVNGAAIAPEQAITRAEALYAYTMGGAIASGDADNRGSLTPGKWADLVILDGDPLTAADPTVLRVVATYVGGEQRYAG
ncbi:MAG: amidohydrolase [Candidatus Flexifilum sp.]